jgi:hypothetical protein
MRFFPGIPCGGGRKFTLQCDPEGCRTQILEREWQKLYVTPILDQKAIGMRTLLFLLAGFLLLATCVLLGRLFSTNYAGASLAATWTFVVLWLGISTANLWVGVAKAGYTLGDELPIFLLIFVVPAAVAIFLEWRS